MTKRSSPRTPSAPVHLDAVEAAFLTAYRPDAYPRPAVTVDLVVLTVVDAELRVLLVRRNEHPSKGGWALPGGFVRVGDGHRDQGEDLEAAAARELEEETGLKPTQVVLAQLATFGRAGRDPRMRVVTVAYYALVRPDLVPLVRPGGDANEVGWREVEAARRSKLAFDHKEILETALGRLRSLIASTDIAAGLVPATFTIPELRHVHGLVTGEPPDPGNFRRRVQRMLEDKIIEQAPGKRITSSKPALVYRFTSQRR